MQGTSAGDGYVLRDAPRILLRRYVTGKHCLASPVAQCSAERQRAASRLESRNCSAQAQHAKHASAAQARNLRLVNASQARQTGLAGPGWGWVCDEVCSDYVTSRATRHGAERGVLPSGVCSTFSPECKLSASSLECMLQASIGNH